MFQELVKKNMYSFGYLLFMANIFQRNKATRSFELSHQQVQKLTAFPSLPPAFLSSQ